jgi:hypothetical protein
VVRPQLATTSVPIVFAIMIMLIIISLLHRIQSEPRDDLSCEGEQRQGFRTDAISLVGC